MPHSGTGLPLGRLTAFCHLPIAITILVSFLQELLFSKLLIADASRIYPTPQFTLAAPAPPGPVFLEPSVVEPPQAKMYFPSTSQPTSSISLCLSLSLFPGCRPPPISSSHSICISIGRLTTTPLLLDPLRLAVRDFICYSPDHTTHKYHLAAWWQV